MCQEENSDFLKAVREGREPEVRSLISGGAKIEERGKFGATPLIISATKGYITLAKILLEQGADPNARIDGDGTALIQAALNGHAEIANLLLEHGAAIDATDENGFSALMWACADDEDVDKIEVVRTLLSRGADCNIATKEGLTAKDIAEDERIKKLLPHADTEDHQSSGQCFIATASCGSVDAWEVIALRKYRDNVILLNPFGQWFVRQYYRVSPPLAGFVERNSILRMIVRYSIVMPIALLARLKMRLKRASRSC